MSNQVDRRLGLEYYTRQHPYLTPVAEADAMETQPPDSPGYPFNLDAHLAMTASLMKKVIRDDNGTPFRIRVSMQGFVLQKQRIIVTGIHNPTAASITATLYEGLSISFLPEYDIVLPANVVLSNLDWYFPNGVTFGNFDAGYITVSGRCLEQ